METDIEIDDEFVRRIKEEVEEAVTKELCDPVSAKTILSQVDRAVTEAQCEEKKAAITKILLASTWTQRLYFDIRSAMMALMSGGTTFIVIWYFATINFIQALFLGIFVFVFSLVISRLFDTAITKASKKIVKHLSKQEIENVHIKEFLSGIQVRSFSAASVPRLSSQAYATSLRNCPAIHVRL